MNLALFAILTLLQIADVCTTYVILLRGFGYEANPLMARSIAELGLLPGLIVPKLLTMVPAYLWARAVVGVPWVDHMQTAIFIALVLYYLRVVLGNWRIIRVHR